MALPDKKRRLQRRKGFAAKVRLGFEGCVIPKRNVDCAGA